MASTNSISDVGAHGLAADSSALVLRVYNYYRLFLSFCLLHFYLNVPDQQLVGQLHPGLYQELVYTYFITNCAIAITCLSVPQRYLSMRIPIFILFCADIIFFGLLMYSSGGINSILGNFLIISSTFLEFSRKRL